MLADLMSGLLWNTLLASLAILLVLAIRTPILHGFGARIAYLLWSIVPVVMIASMLPASEYATPMQRLVLDAEPAQMMPAVSAQVIATKAMLEARNAWLLIWIAGFVSFACAMIIQQRRFVAGLGSLSERDGIHYASNASSGPALLGLFPPRIVVPSDFDTLYDDHERELILRHEHMHRKRGDHWSNALVVTVRGIFWFNPLVHAAAAAFKRDQELACDELVVASHPSVRRAYASAMLKAGLQSQPLPIGCQWQSIHPLKERVMMLRKNKVTPGRRRGGIALFALMAASASFAAWAMQPASTKQRIEVELRFSGEDAVDQTLRHAVLDADEVLHVEVGQAAQKKLLDISFKPLSPGRIEAKGVVHADGKILSNPQILFEEGKPVSMSVQNDSEGDASAPAKAWEINLTARVLNASSTSLTNEVADVAQMSAGVDAMPQYARLSPPLHPRDASGQKIDGTVYLSVRVGRDGLPVDIQRLKVEPESISVSMSERLVGAAVDAVRTWTFVPAERNGEKVEGNVIVPITFGADDPTMQDAKLSGAANTLDNIRISES